MTSIGSKAFIVASLLFALSGAAEAKSFLKQAGTDIGNGFRAAVPHASPRPPPAPMSPCTVKPGACGTAGKVSV